MHHRILTTLALLVLMVLPAHGQWAGPHGSVMPPGRGTVLHFWIEDTAAAQFVATTCLLFAEGDFATVLPQTCTSTTGVHTTGAYFPPGFQPTATQLVCSGIGTSVTGTAALDVRWRKGDAAGTLTDSTASLSIPAASFNSTLVSGTINSTCPYSAEGCIASIHTKTAPSGGTGIDLSCDLFVNF